MPLVSMSCIRRPLIPEVVRVGRPAPEILSQACSIAWKYSNVNWADLGVFITNTAISF